MHSQKGAGLTEMMIGLFLASLIMTALMNHYICVKRHYVHLQAAMDDAMELQLASDVLRNSIRQSGFTPCLRIDHLISLDHRSGHENIVAFETGSELSINRMNPYFDSVLNIVSPTQVVATHENTIHAARAILIADCYHAEVILVTEINHRPTEQVITLNNPLIFTYQPPVYIGEWLHERYFIGPQGGLFYKQNHAEELTSVITSMSAKYDKTHIHLSLGMNDGRTIKLETKIRAQ